LLSFLLDFSITKIGFQKVHTCVCPDHRTASSWRAILAVCGWKLSGPMVPLCAFAESENVRWELQLSRICWKKISNYSLFGLTAQTRGHLGRGVGFKKLSPELFFFEFFSMRSWCSWKWTAMFDGNIRLFFLLISLS